METDYRTASEASEPQVFEPEAPSVYATADAFDEIGAIPSEASTSTMSSLHLWESEPEPPQPEAQSVIVVPSIVRPAAPGGHPAACVCACALAAGPPEPLDADALHRARVTAAANPRYLAGHRRRCRRCHPHPARPMPFCRTLVASAFAAAVPARQGAALCTSLCARVVAGFSARDSAGRGALSTCITDVA